MRFARLLFPMVALLLWANVAMASPADVNFGIKDPGCSSCIVINSSSFSFIMPNVPAGQTVAIDFLNNTGMTLTSLSLNLFTGTNVTPSLFTCTVGAFFDTCLVTQITSTIAGDNEFHVLLENLHPNSACQPDMDNDGDDQCGGIQPGQGFEFELTNPPGTDTSFDWAGENLTVNVSSTTPEPGTLALLATGLVPLWSLRRKLFR